METLQPVEIMNFVSWYDRFLTDTAFKEEYDEEGTFENFIDYLMTVHEFTRKNEKL